MSDFHIPTAFTVKQTILNEVLKALADDPKTFPRDENPALYIPSRATTLVSKAIERGFEKAKADVHGDVEDDGA